MQLKSFTTNCPYCGEAVEISLDYSAGDQDYYEDCQVCCRPMRIELVVGMTDEDINCTIRRDDE